MEARSNIENKARELQARVGPEIREAARGLEDLNARIVEFIRQRPGTCLLGALAFGFIVGKIASRR
ncbi:MAG TPA: hypothetical protein VKE49_13700 [Myxococcaceae bacterium]|nr:hypothetical protein [Myxococcaceae bacterium]